MTLSSNKSKKWGIVLAAGFGTRLRPITDTIPKPLINIGGKTLLDHTIDNMIQSGINNIVVNGHYKWEQIRDHINQKFNRDDVNVHFILEPDILETGGGVMNIMEKFDIESALVSNSDTLLISKEVPALDLLSNFDEDAEFVMMVQHKSKSLQGISRGDLKVIDGNKFIFDPIERGDYIFLGSYFLKRSIFSDRQYVSKFSMIDYISKSKPDTYNSLKYYIVEYDGIFLDIGTVDMLNKAISILQNLS